jgi:hypothetical protein
MCGEARAGRPQCEVLNLQTASAKCNAMNPCMGHGAELSDGLPYGYSLFTR